MTFWQKIKKAINSYRKTFVLFALVISALLFSFVSPIAGLVSSLFFMALGASSSSATPKPEKPRAATPSKPEPEVPAARASRPAPRAPHESPAPELASDEEDEEEEELDAGAELEAVVSPDGEGDSADESEFEDAVEIATPGALDEQIQAAVSRARLKSDVAKALDDSEGLLIETEEERALKLAERRAERAKRREQLAPFANAMGFVAQAFAEKGATRGSMAIVVAAKDATITSVRTRTLPPVVKVLTQVAPPAVIIKAAAASLFTGTGTVGAIAKVAAVSAGTSFLERSEFITPALTDAAEELSNKAPTEQAKQLFTSARSDAGKAARAIKAMVGYKSDEDKTPEDNKPSTREAVSGMLMGIGRWIANKITGETAESTKAAQEELQSRFAKNPDDSIMIVGDRCVRAEEQRAAQIIQFACRAHLVRKDFYNPLAAEARGHARTIKALRRAGRLLDRKKID